MLSMNLLQFAHSGLALVGQRNLRRPAISIGCDAMMSSLSPLEQRILSLLEPLRRHLRASLATPLISKLSVEDIVQETFVRAVAACDMAKFENEAMMLAWLKRIATNISISAIRKKGPMTVLFSHSSETVRNIFDSGVLTPSDAVSNEENRNLLAIAMTKLAEHHQRVVHLRYHDQLSFEQIAREMNSTASAIRGLHRNALEKLRVYMGEIALYYSSQ